jgi:hypothetical protein
VKNKLTKEPFTPTSQNWTAKLTFIWQKKKLYRNLNNYLNDFIMTTVHLEIKDAAYGRFLETLKGFDSNEIKIVSEDSHLAKSKAYIKKQLDEIDAGKATFYSIEEVEASLDKIISKYESNSK